MQYRPDIDGLRAIAVVSVVLYHAGLGPFSGGFVGVDIFFVISGYLITSQIWPEVTSTTFSLVGFYERRARRILPALFAVLILVLAVGSILLLPKAYEATAMAAGATVFSLSNFYFWQQTGYFGGAAELVPLLHTWSLAVEEQFYFFFPLALLSLAKLGRRWVTALLAVAVVLSLAFGVWASVNMPSVAFYLAPSRAWELGLGALLAMCGCSSPKSKVAREALAAGGLATVLAATILISSSAPFPGYVALLPCLGAAAVIIAGAGTVAGRVLAWRPVVFVGLVSYSFYLWHWPALVAARHMVISTELMPYLSATVVLCSFALAVLSWRFIERPFRNRQKIGRGLVFAGSGAGALCILLAAGSVVNASGFPDRFDSTALAYANAADGYSALGRRCLGAMPSARCEFGTEGQDVSFLLWGDSHAGALVPAMEAAAKALGLRGIFVGYNSCPPLLEVAYGGNTAPDQKECLDINRAAVGFVSKSSIKNVVLVANWNSYLNGQTVAQSPEDSSTSPLSVFDRGLARTIRALSASGKSVTLIGGLPSPGTATPWAFALAEHLGRSLPKIAPPPGGDKLLRALQRIKLPVAYISLREAICDSGGNCAPTTPEGLVFADGNHLSSASASLLGPFLARRLWKQDAVIPRSSDAAS